MWNLGEAIPGVYMIIIINIDNSLWMNNTFDMFINFYENPIITLNWTSCIYHWANFIKLKRNFEILKKLFWESVNSFGNIICDTLSSRTSISLFTTSSKVIDFPGVLVYYTHHVTPRKVWIVNKQRKTLGIYMKILKVELTVNAPEINFNSYIKKHRKKCTTFSFNLSAIENT